MKNKFQFLTKVLLGVIIAFVQNPAYGVELGMKLKSLKVTTDSGKVDLISSAPAKIYVFNFWATWCEACKIELKEMDAMFAPIAANKSVKMAFVSLDKDIADAKAWASLNLKGSLVRNRLFYDPEFRLAEELEIDAFPMTIVLDSKDGILYIQRGFKEGERSTEKILEIINKKLETIP